MKNFSCHHEYLSLLYYIPFPPTIRYQLNNTNNVQLIIYDIVGREVKTLINQRQKVGQHTITFDASDLASGIYIYKLKAGDFEQTRKMILVH